MWLEIVPLALLGATILAVIAFEFICRFLDWLMSRA